MKRSSLVFLLFFMSISWACAHVPSNLILEGDQPSVDHPVELSALVAQIPRGSIIILSEVHNLLDHHQNHTLFLNALIEERSAPVHVALEFLSWPDQHHVEAYRMGQIDAQEFKERVSFGADFPWYNDKILLAFQNESKVFAVNSPRNLSMKIARGGIEALSDEERAFLPPNFTLGNERYKARFVEVMTGGAHPLPPEALERYFIAQSLWDDSMAWKLIQAREQHRGEDIVMIVGDFHAIYGGGLKDRLVSRGVDPRDVVVISQVQLKGLKPSEQHKEIEPHPVYGKRADYIWTARSEVIGERP
jgi:uncharacterized iron-regulated protein